MKKRQVSLNKEQEKHVKKEAGRLNVAVNSVIVMLINKDIEDKEAK